MPDRTQASLGWPAGCLRASQSATVTDRPAFAAEQFLQLVVALPQRRALGTPMTEAELDTWADDCVNLPQRLPFLAVPCVGVEATEGDSLVPQVSFS